jgi:hypothetical protein
MSETIIRQIIEHAEKKLRERWENGLVDKDEPQDTIHEIAATHVPISNITILECAVDDIDLATSEPKLGPAFEGSPTPINIIAANIYEAIEQALWELYRELQEEEEDEVEEMYQLKEDKNGDNV